MQIAIADLMTSSGVGFGTSGARGLVTAMTDKVCYAYTVGFLQYLKQSSDSFSQVAIAGDLRPSTQRILKAVGKAITDMDLECIYCDTIPSPAVALFGLKHAIPSIMVTGSHIPDDRNGIKFNTADGEISKQDETGIRQQVIHFDEQLFNDEGLFSAPVALPAANHSARHDYQQRFIDFFGNNALTGMTIGLYQHSGVGRDLILEILHQLGAETVALGRSEVFVPVDTEAIREEDITLARQWAAEQSLDAIVSTDGDADRPLLSDHQGNWLRGDSVGCLCARVLGAQYVVTPVSSNTQVDKSQWFKQVNRSRIGSPFVIAGMQALSADGKQQIVGYEANGGFLQQDVLSLQDKTLSPLPTRDAVIVFVAILAYCNQHKLTVAAFNAQLPARFTHSDRIKNIVTADSQQLIASLNSGDFGKDSASIKSCLQIDDEVLHIDTTDGLRITWKNLEITHLRPSGNAPELRCYTESDSTERAMQLNRHCLQMVQQAVSSLTI